MLNRHVDGEPEEFARLRGKIVTLCDIEHFNKNMSILRENAKKNGITMLMALYVWEKAHTPDLTTKSGMSESHTAHNPLMTPANYYEHDDNRRAFTALQQKLRHPTDGQKAGFSSQVDGWLRT